MKRIIKGTTYSTATSVPLHHWWLDRYFKRERETLYRTRRGDWFLFIEHDDAITGEPMVRQIQPLESAHAKMWIKVGPSRIGQFKQLSKPEDHKEAVVYLRIRESLKTSLESRAKKKGQSLNAYLTKVLDDLETEPSPAIKKSNGWVA